MHDSEIPSSCGENYSYFESLLSNSSVEPRAREFIGVLPAAGTASRLPSLQVPKELIPVALVKDKATGKISPIVAAEFSLLAMRRAGLKKCMIIINNNKPEILRYFGDGAKFKMSIAYVNQVSPSGLAAAIDTASAWIDNAFVCLALPDTMYAPCDAPARINEALLRQGADIVLGVFPTDTPEQLGPVRIAEGGIVTEVLEKPTATDLKNTWGIAAWGPRFTKFLRLSKHINRSIGHVFGEAAVNGLRVRAIFFEEGHYSDLGTETQIATLLGKQVWEI